MTDDHAVERALRAWRDAERALAEATPGSPVAVEATIAFDLARREYAQAVKQRTNAGARLVLESDDEHSDPI